MQNQIIITELNKPSAKALKAFNQQVFQDIQTLYGKGKSTESEVETYD